MSRIQETFEWANPNEFLPEDRHLVELCSLEGLTTVLLDARIAWKESMRAALSAVEHACIKRTMEHTNCVDYSSLQASYFHQHPLNQRAPTFKR